MDQQPVGHVVALHGGSGSGRDFLWTWLREARGRRFLLAAPTAQGPTWSLMGPDLDSRNLRAMEAAVISATMIHGGEATNVVPDACQVSGTVRTLSDAAVDTIERRMREVAEGICAAHGAACDFRFDRGYPVTVNHAAETDFVRQVLGGVVGADRVLPFEPTMGSEDFSFFLQEKPGCYFMIGNGDGAHRAHGHGEGPCTLHNPNYDFNDELIPLGATCWVRLAEEWLRAPR